VKWTFIVGLLFSKMREAVALKLKQQLIRDQYS
jgi:hypothetical protein